MQAGTEKEMRMNSPSITCSLLNHALPGITSQSKRCNPDAPTCTKFLELDSANLLGRYLPVWWRVFEIRCYKFDLRCVFLQSLLQMPLVQNIFDNFIKGYYYSYWRACSSHPRTYSSEKPLYTSIPDQWPYGLEITTIENLAYTLFSWVLHHDMLAFHKHINKWQINKDIPTARKTIIYLCMCTTFAMVDS